MFGIIGIILSLALLIFLAYKGWSVIIVAPILAVLAASFAVLDGGTVHLLATYTEVFMTNAAGYVKNYYPVFLLGAIFGKVMDDSGAAKSIALAISDKIGHGKEVWAIAIAGGIITYGGVSMFVAAFALYPIGAALFKQAEIPKRFLPASIAIGTFTYSMTGLPGSPQIQNAIPMKFLGTDAFAAPVLGIIAAIIMLTGGGLWVSRRVAKAKLGGEGYGDHGDEHLHGLSREGLPSVIISLVPMIVVLLGNLLLSKVVFPSADVSYLEAEYNILPAAVLGTWSLIVALIAATLSAILLNYKRFDNILGSLRDGVQGSFLAIMNTASEVGYGNVIKTLAAFTIVGGAMMGLTDNVLINEAVISSVLAGITGSASGGVSIALAAFGEQFLAEAAAAGIDPQVLHRVAAVACGGLDSLPHNGAVITLLGITGLTHKQSYLDIGMCTVVIPTVATVVVVALGTMGVV